MLFMAVVNFIIHVDHLNTTTYKCSFVNIHNTITSGGPLIVPGSSASQDILIGVTSWGIGCATRVFPGVFARVSRAYDWIAETVCETSTNPPGYMCETPEPSAKPSREPTPEVS